MQIARPPSRITKRSTIPSVKGIEAASEAMIVAKGLMVEPSTPMPAPIRMIATPVTAS